MSDILSDLLSGLIERRAWGCVISLVGIIVIGVILFVAIGTAD